MHVAEAYIHQRLEFLFELRHVSQHGQRVLNREVQNIRDRVAVELHRQRLLVVAPSVAHFALDVDVGHEVHLDAPLPITLARLAPAP